MCILRKDGLPATARGIAFGLASVVALLVLAIVRMCWAAEPAQPEFLKTLNVTGFVQNTSGTFLDTHAIEYNRSKNSLAVERNLIQVDINDDLTDRDSMFMRMWGVYEPSYPNETGCLSPFLAVVHCNSDFYNQYGIREVWLKHRQGPLQLLVGRQIVTWGESLSFRVGDQINPQDLSWNFGFANLEQSRNPLWMIHPVWNIRRLGPFSSNFLEAVYIPGFDFLYTQVDYSNDQYDGQDQVAGRVNINQAIPGGRFAGRIDDRLIGSPGVVVEQAPPFLTARTFPVTGLVLAANVNGVPSMADQAIPRATWANSQVGVRLHTLIWNTEITAMYYYNHDYNPVVKLFPQQGFRPIGPGLFTERAKDVYPIYQAVGATANRAINLPGRLADLPLVVRTEALYKNHEAFNTLAIPGTFFTHFLPTGASSGLVHSDVLLWLFALDIASAYVPRLTSTGNLNANFELNGTTILSYNNLMTTPGYFERQYHNDINLLFHVDWSWWWNAVAPGWTSIYNPDGQTWLFFPSCVFTPPWTNKYLMKLQWIEILGTNAFGLDGGIFKGKSMLLAQFQYNFSWF